MKKLQLYILLYFFVLPKAICSLNVKLQEQLMVRCSISSCQVNVMFRENHKGLVTSDYIHISVVRALGYIFSGQGRAF